MILTIHELHELIQAPKGKNPNPSGLGRAIINKKAKDARHAFESGNVSVVENTFNRYHGSICLFKYTTDMDSTSRLKSVTQEKDLDEFLNTATLAGTEFTAGEWLFLPRGIIVPSCLFSSLKNVETWRLSKLPQIRLRIRTFCPTNKKRSRSKSIKRTNSDSEFPEDRPGQKQWLRHNWRGKRRTLS